MIKIKEEDLVLTDDSLGMAKINAMISSLYDEAVMSMKGVSFEVRDRKMRNLEILSNKERDNKRTLLFKANVKSKSILFFGKPLNNDQIAFICKEILNKIKADDKTK